MTELLPDPKRALLGISVLGSRGLWITGPRITVQVGILAVHFFGSVTSGKWLKWEKKKKVCQMAKPKTLFSKELKSIRWKTHFSPPIPLITHTPHYPLQVYPSSVGKCMHIFAFMYASNIHMASCYIHSSFLPHNFFIAVKNISVLWGSIYILKY